MQDQIDGLEHHAPAKAEADAATLEQHLWRSGSRATLRPCRTRRGAGPDPAINYAVWRGTEARHQIVVMGREQHRSPAFLAQDMQPMQKILLPCPIETSGRLIGAEQGRPAQQSDRQQHLLALTTRELVRVAAQNLLGLFESESSQS